MVNTDKIRGIIAERGYSQKDIADVLNITPKTFYEKMAKGIFGTDEAKIMIDFLKIENPAEIFFAD